MNLIRFELDILEECAHRKPIRSWGAAVAAALEVLRGGGYIDRFHQITEKGRKTLDEERPR